MNTEPYIIVAGFGRCGTSAMMQMLWHGGCKVTGPAPAFEDQRANPLRLDAEWMANQRGRAVKHLVIGTPKLSLDAPAKIIWMDRAHKDQARSQAKMAMMLADNTGPKGINVGRMARSMDKERPLALGALRKQGEVMRVHFRDLLRDPEGTAKAVQGFLGGDMFPDWRQGAQAILKRDHKCAPDMRVEAALMRAFDAMGADMPEGETA